MGTNNAKMFDLELFQQAGFQRFKSPTSSLCEAIKKNLRVLDEQNAINRYKWYNLPNGLTSQLMERILYYKGQGMFFYMETDEHFYFLPYALDGTIDVYGRYTGTTPLPFNGKTTDTDNKAWITGLVRKPVYTLEEVLDIKDTRDACVLLTDYCKQMSQTTIPRQQLQEPILQAMAEAYPMARTSLIANSGVKGMRVADQDQQSQVKMASRSVEQAALTGDPWIPIVGSIEFQDLTNAGSALKSEEYLLYMQSMDSFRLSLYGLSSGGIFQKKAHMLQSEEDNNSTNTGLVYEDGLINRQEFADIVNAIWGLKIVVKKADVLEEEEEKQDMAGQEQVSDMKGGSPADDEMGGDDNAD